MSDREVLQFDEEALVVDIRERQNAIKNLYKDFDWEDLTNRISSDQSQSEEVIKDYILKAAYDYVFFNELNQNIEPPYKSRLRLKALQSRTVALKQAFMELCESPDLTTDVLRSELHEAIGESEFLSAFLTSPVEPYNFYKNEFYAFVEMLEYLNTAIANSYGAFEAEQAIKSHKPIERWLSVMETVFTQYSDIPFSQGKYIEGAGRGFESRCLDILHDVIIPIDQDVTKQWLAGQIKKYKASNR